MTDHDQNIFDPDLDTAADRHGHSSDSAKPNGSGPDHAQAPGLFDTADPAPDQPDSYDVPSAATPAGIFAFDAEVNEQHQGELKRRAAALLRRPGRLKKTATSLACALLAFLAASLLGGMLRHAPHSATGTSTTTEPRAASVQPASPARTRTAPRKATRTRRIPRRPRPRPAAHPRPAGRSSSSSQSPPAINPRRVVAASPPPTAASPPDSPPVTYRPPPPSYSPPAPAYSLPPPASPSPAPAGGEFSFER